MSASTRSSRLSGWLSALTAITLVSCQSDPVSPKGEVTPQVNLRFQESAVALRPDSVSWRLGGESARADFASEVDHPENFRAWFDLPRPLGKDTILLSTWRYGMRTSVLPYAGEEPNLDGSHIVRDQLARDLLIRHQTKNTADSKAYPADPAGVRRVYAECLLSRESMCPDAPPVLPVGMDSAALIDELCRELARRKLPFSTQIQAPFFAWTPMAWKEVVIGRVARRILTSQDSSVLFPTELVVRQKASITQVLRAGGSAVAMGGRFAWNTDKKVESFVEIRTLQGRIADGFQVVLPQPGASDTSLALDGRSSLRAGSQVAAGKYQRIVGVRDAEGRVARWTDTFQVAAMDTARMTRVAGVSARTVPYDSAKVWVAWKGEPSRMDSVWIDGILVSPRDSTWGVWVEPAPGGKVVVDLRARTTDGIWLEDRVEVARQARLSAPSLVPLPGCQRKIVPFDSTSAMVGWQEDSGLVDSVWIQGNLVERSGNGFYRKNIDLSAGVGVREVMVVAKRGNLLFRDTVSVERRPDTIPPAILQGPSSLDPVGDSTRVSAAWVVTDNDSVDTVWIDGRAVGRVGNTFSRTWMVDTARRSLEIQAKDRSGNRSTDSLIILPFRDSIAPVLTAMPGTVSRAVPADTMSIVVAWRASDNRRVKTVRIQDSVVVGVGGVYATQVPLAIGKNVIRVNAIDPSGNQTTDTIVVERRDAQGPRLRRITPVGSDTTLGESADTLEAIWEVTDPSGLDTVEIDGKPATKNGDRYSSRRAIPYGKSRMRIRAVDSDGHLAQDSILVERIDRTAPRLTLQGPRRDTAVESGTDSMQVSWQAEDSWGVKRLEIDRVETRGVSGVYGRKIPLAFGWNTVVVQATDSAGNAARDSVRIYRPSANGLRLYRDLPTLADSVVADSVTSISVAYFATSPVRIDTVSINGQWTQLDATGEARRDVRLATGPNRIPVMAVDRDKNRRVDTVKVYRRDQTPPVLVRQTGTTSKSVDSAQTSITLAWQVSDNYAVKQVRINGAVVSSSTGIYSQTVNLGYGTNHVTVVAFDSAGNYKADTILIKRDSLIVSAPSLSTVRLARLELPGSQAVVVPERRTVALARGAKPEDLS
ncbi:MAG: cadherin-like beta sandwich domain-containing protein [Fibrobacteres bacterium]|nr:cadherin-like beta sandwich domain-containing protein [Fibrobacterota bacterium]